MIAATQSLESLATELAHGLVSHSPDAQISARKRYNVAIELMGDNEPMKLDFAIKVAQLAETLRHGQEANNA